MNMYKQLHDSPTLTHRKTPRSGAHPEGGIIHPHQTPQLHRQGGA